MTSKLSNFWLTDDSLRIVRPLRTDEGRVRPFPGPGGKWQISSGGGGFPKWSRSGKELFYRTTFNLTRGPASRIMVVTYTVSRESFHADKPRLWSPGQFTDLGVFVNFDLHPEASASRC